MLHRVKKLCLWYVMQGPSTSQASASATTFQETANKFSVVLYRERGGCSLPNVSAFSVALVIGLIIKKELSCKLLACLDISWNKK